MCAWTEQGSAAMSMRQYEIPTGRVGLLTLWGGLFLQISTIVLLAGLSETSAQTVGTAVAAYFISMAIYFVVDIVWVMGIELRLNNYFFDENEYKRPALQRAVLLPAFFLVAAAANTLVVILPALDESQYDTKFNFWTVALRGFTMGWFAYGNLARVQAWSYRNFPLEIIGVMPLSGGALSMVSSILTTFICKQF